MSWLGDFGDAFTPNTKAEQENKKLVKGLRRDAREVEGIYGPILSDLGSAYSPGGAYQDLLMGRYMQEASQRQSKQDLLNRTSQYKQGVGGGMTPSASAGVASLLASMSPQVDTDLQTKLIEYDLAKRGIDIGSMKTKIDTGNLGWGQDAAKAFGEMYRAYQNNGSKSGDNGFTVDQDPGKTGSFDSGVVVT